VVDRWQGNRVGTALALALLTDLRARGVTCVVGTVFLDNRPAVALFRRFGARRIGPIEGGVMEMRAVLPRGPTRARGPRGR
jgi:ribosomal protein S18 acetylase RimI-like enzyme